MNSGSGLNSTCRIVHHLLTLGVFCFLFFLLFILLMATSVFVSEGTEIFTQVKGVILNKKEQVVSAEKQTSTSVFCSVYMGIVTKTK